MSLKSLGSTISIVILILISFQFCKSPIKSKDVVFTKENSPYHLKQDLIIEDSVRFIIEPGVVIYLDSLVNIHVYSDLIIKGTAKDPIQISAKGNHRWGKLNVYPSASKVDLQYVEINDGSVNIECPEVDLSSISFTMHFQKNWDESLIKIKNGTARIKNSDFKGENGGDGILIVNSANSSVINCTFLNVSDAVEFISSNNCDISNCTFENSSDDAIDLNNCMDIRISENTISGIQDRGIEIGSEGFGNSEDIKLYKNVIAHCGIGISFKENSNGLIESNTLYSNTLGVEVIQEDSNLKGSNAYILNSILFQNEVDLFQDEYSRLEIQNSISNLSLFPGENNLFGDPFLIDPANQQFDLSQDSPCIDAGYKFSPLDPDSTIADMGAFYYHQ